MKILIGCPTSKQYEYCTREWIECVKKVIDFSKEKDVDVEYVLIDNSESEDFFQSMKSLGVNILKTQYSEEVRKRIADSRNILRDKLLAADYDYFFSLEQDILPEKDIIIRLLSHKKQIVSAYYAKMADILAKDKESGEIKKFLIELPIVFFQEGEKLRRVSPLEVLDKGLIKVGAFGLGCVLISREVLEKISFRYKKEKLAFDDMFFCIDAKKQGYDLFLDSGVRVEHFHTSVRK